jgi:hypothetical protein
MPETPNFSRNCIPAIWRAFHKKEISDGLSFAVFGAPPFAGARSAAFLSSSWSVPRRPGPKLIARRASLKDALDEANGTYQRDRPETATPTPRAQPQS